MSDLDLPVILIGGTVLIVSFTFFSSGVFLLVLISGLGFLAWKYYRRGWRVSVGLNGLKFFRLPRQANFRPLSSFLASRKPVLRSSSPKYEKPLYPTSPWGQTASFGSPVLSPDYYIGSSCRQDLRSTSFKRLSPGITFQETSKFHSAYQQESPKHGSSRSKMDAMFSKSDLSFNPICDEKYAGVGIYPTVNLNPRLPILLSSSASITKNRVTVKIAPPSRGIKMNMGIDGQVNDNSDCMKSTGGKCDVAEALKGARKRPSKDHLNNKRAVQKRQKVDSLSPICSYNDPITPLIPNGVSCQFGSRANDDDSMKILPPSFEIDQDITAVTYNRPALISRAQTNAILSSYSSSQRWAEKRNNERLKRKLEDFGVEASERKEKKIAHNQTASELQKLEEMAGRSELDTVDTSKTSISEQEESNIFKELRTESSVSKSSSSSPVSDNVKFTGIRNVLPMHIPRYIPTLNDYLEDKKSNQERLQKLLSTISSSKDKEGNTDTLKADQNLTALQGSRPAVSTTASPTAIPSLVLTTLGPFSKETTLEAPRTTAEISLPAFTSTAFATPTITSQAPLVVSSISEDKDDKSPELKSLLPASPSTTLSPTQSFQTQNNGSATGNSPGQITSYSSTSNTLTVVTSPSNTTVSGVRPAANLFTASNVNAISSIGSSVPQASSPVSSSISTTFSKAGQPDLSKQFQFSSSAVSMPSSSLSASSRMALSGNGRAFSNPAAGASLSTASTSTSFAPNFFSTNGTSLGTKSTTSVFSPGVSSVLTFGTNPSSALASGASPSAAVAFGATPSAAVTFETTPGAAVTFGTTPSAAVTFGTTSAAVTFGTSSAAVTFGTSSAAVTFGTTPSFSLASGAGPSSTVAPGAVSGSAVTFGVASSIGLASGSGPNLTLPFGAAHSSGSQPGTGHFLSQGTTSANIKVSSAVTPANGPFFGQPNMSQQMPQQASTSQPQWFGTSNGPNSTNQAASKSETKSIFPVASGAFTSLDQNVLKPVSSPASTAISTMPNFAFSSPFAAQSANSNKLGGFAFAGSCNPGLATSNSTPGMTPISKSGLANQNTELNASIFAFGTPQSSQSGVNFVVSPKVEMTLQSNSNTLVSNSSNNNNNQHAVSSNLFPTTKPVIPVSGFSFKDMTPTTSFGNPGTSTPKSTNSGFQFNGPSFASPVTSTPFSAANSSGAGANSSNLFTFGSPSTTSNPGFTFNPTPKPGFSLASSVPAFAPNDTASMFSIGSGSSGPRRSKFGYKNRPNR